MQLAHSDYLRTKVRMADREASSLGKDADNALKDIALLIEKSDGDIQRQRARLSGTKPNASKWKVGRNLNTGGNKVQRAWVYIQYEWLTENQVLLAKDADNALKDILENDAGCRWKMIDSKWIAAQTVRTWELFKTEFNKNYNPRSVKLKREAQFWNFEQRNLTVQQYATKFTSLARHASYLVEGEDKRARKFQDGLKPEIQEKISIRNVDDYYEMVDKALLIEKSDGDIIRKWAQLSGTRPNASKWKLGRNLNTSGNKVQRAGVYIH
ncbi:hypothetical protein RJ640_022448 [Escallonia rubra]|uniref:Retrotransposon gag domain-containing protein n=1 Tax=Escallonia rubra TaxID=112253 RepID=A0AA88QDM7_9ASTE|nr:hypothetical protein RJ640_022448 [Escallonia rubra]